MPHTGGQPKPRTPRGSSTKSQPRHKGRGSKGGKMTSRLKSYKVRGQGGY